MSSVLHRQYHACWCSGDFRSQGISRYGIDPQGWNIRSTASDELIVHYKCNIFLWNWLNAIRNLSALFILMASRVLQHQSISSHNIEYPSMCFLGADSIKRCHLASIGNPIVEIRRSYDRLISTMGFPILVRWHLYIESGPRCLWGQPTGER